MKQKVGTVIDARLIRQAKTYAAQHGKPLSGVIEEALAAYLEHRTPRATAGGLIEASSRTVWFASIPSAPVHHFARENGERESFGV